MKRGILLVAAVAGCDAGAPDGLVTDGPPDVLQVLVKERNAETGAIESRLAYGDHPDIDESDDREVTDAVARDGQRIRIVVDELLRGNFLEEVACADGSWSRVPVGSDFDDVARCSGPDLSACEGICIGASGPVGILDENGDGGFDDTRLIEGAVVLTCDGEVVPLDPQRSYYQPSGSQRLSAGSVGTDSLGPAVVIAPADGMRPGSTCGIAFADTVVDKQDVRVPDTSAISFGVEPFLAAAFDPPDGATDVAPEVEGSAITVGFNATLESATVTATAGGEPIEDLEPAVDGASVVVPRPNGFRPATTYVVTVTDVRDVWGDELDDVTFTFTTAAE